MPESILSPLFHYPLAPAKHTLSTRERAAAFAILIALTKYNEANLAIRADKNLNNEEKNAIKRDINEHILIPRQLEWTNHGVLKTFRFWDLKEKIEYIREANQLINVLREFSEHVSFGFGSVLALVRDEDFIPHDDDLDLLIALDRSTFPEAKRRLREFLAERGYVCHGNNLTHFGVNRGVGTATDVFIGFKEDDLVSWFPSRRGCLRFGEVFPTQNQTFLGELVPVPRDVSRYLEVTYGADWQEPISNWNHPWDAQEYREFF